MRRAVFAAILAAFLLGGTVQAARDITGPGDPIIGIPNDGLTTGGQNNGWPANEPPLQAIDDRVNTKYLHFKGNAEPTGIRVTPGGEPGVVTELTLTTANDAAERDPVEFELYGSNESIDGPYTLIASGEIVDFNQSAAWPRLTKNTTPIIIENDTVYAHYQLMFPKVRDAGSANSMQIADIELLVPQLQATDPNPADGADDVVIGLLRWTAADQATFERIYFGTTEELTEADLVIPQQPAGGLYFAAGLTPGQTYYWRVDAIAADGTVTEGKTWSFLAAPLTAYKPTPLDGDKWISVDTDLQWQPGQGATAHTVYFGTDRAAVEARDPGTLLGETVAPEIDLPTLEQNTQYFWAVDESGGGDQPGPVWTFTTEGGGGGIKGEYFTNTTLSGLPAVTRIDQTVNINTDESVADGIPADGWSARWTADLEIAIADAYTFSVNSQDGTRLWIDGELLIDVWGITTVTSQFYSVPIELEPGTHSLRLEFFDSGGTAVQELYWSSSRIEEQIIPAGPLQPPLRARTLYPPDEAVDIPQDVTLVWSSGEKADSHDVYFGQDANAVANATPADPTYQGSQPLEETSFMPGELDWNKTYYWRVDEVNDVESASPWASAVWSFTTADFLVVDNFESYDDIQDEGGNAVFLTWIDGFGDNANGSLVGYIDPANGTFNETSDVHTGGQAMPFEYNNVTANFSEATREFEADQDWTVNGVTDLTVWYKGAPIDFVETDTGITMSAAGSDIFGSTDEFRYAYRRLSGDGSITVRVDSVDNVDTWTKAGVMIRNGLVPLTKQSHMIVTPSGRVEFQYRPTTGDVTTGFSLGTGSVTLPYWVRLTREGDTITGEHSADGTTWEMLDIDGQTSTTTLSMAGDVYIGLALTSHAAGTPATADFSNITVTGASGSWQQVEIGVDHPGNQPDQMYVTVEDTAGGSATVEHPDGPSAVNVADWTAWKVPLADLAGVNLSRVGSLTLGVGNANMDGAGMLLFDDIRVTKPEPVEE